MLLECLLPAKILQRFQLQIQMANYYHHADSTRLEMKINCWSENVNLPVKLQKFQPFFHIRYKRYFKSKFKSTLFI